MKSQELKSQDQKSQQLKSKGRFAKKKIGSVLRSATALAALIIAGTSQAQVIGDLSPGFPGQPGFPGHFPPVGPSYGMSEEIRVTIGRQYNGFNGLQIYQLMGHLIGGRQVEQVTLQMESPGGRGQAALLEDGRPSGGPQWVGSYRQDYTFFTTQPSHRSLEVRLNGPFYVHEIRVLVNGQVGGRPGRPGRPGGPGHPQPGPVMLQEYVGQNFRGATMLDVDAMVNLHQYRGYRVHRVILRGSTAAGRGQAELKINGWTEGHPQTVGTYTSEYTFYPSRLMRVGQEIQDIDLNLRGNFFVESVLVELGR